jgi:hypothetical protein
MAFVWNSSLHFKFIEDTFDLQIPWLPWSAFRFQNAMSVRRVASSALQRLRMGMASLAIFQLMVGTSLNGQQTGQTGDDRYHHTHQARHCDHRRKPQL